MNISATDLSRSKDNKIVNTVGSISLKDIKNIINICKYSTADRFFRITAFLFQI